MSSSTGTCTGTPTSQGQSRKRASAFEDRLEAFHLGPATRQHLVRSEQAHDEAMMRFLGEQVRHHRSGGGRGEGFCWRGVGFALPLEDGNVRRAFMPPG